MRHSFFSLFAMLMLSSLHAQDTWQRHWDFNGGLTETNGHCPFYCDDPDLTPQSIVLKQSRTYYTNDDPLYRLEPGFKFETRVQINALATSGWSSILRKGKDSQPGAFFLRIDNADEGVKFSLFINFNGNPEPRVSSKVPIELGQWYDIQGGWDGTDAWLTVNGTTSKVRRAGNYVVNREPLQVGPFTGQMDYLKIDGKPESKNLLDGIAFTPANGTRVDMSYAKNMLIDASIPYDPKFDLFPGFTISAKVTFDQLPKGENTIVAKDKSFLLRYDVHGENRKAFAFFAYVNDNWEPNARVPFEVVPGQSYYIVASWDGYKSFIQVNGKSGDTAKTGFSAPADTPIVLGKFPGKAENLSIENPRNPMPIVIGSKVHSLFPRVGEKVIFSGAFTNIGDDIENCTVKVRSFKGLTITPATLDIKAIKNRQVIPFELTLQAEEPVNGIFNLDILSKDKKVGGFHRYIVFSPLDEINRSAKVWNPTIKPTKTYYVDGIAGDNAKDGLTPNTAWADFTNINGKTLNAGERLLIKRGSVINQELQISAQGEPDNYAEIADYGTGHRPTIRRNRHISERCAFITNSQYVVIRNLIVCNAGKGLDVNNNKTGSGILIENCLAHHIEGIYRTNAHGIPEWRDQPAAPGGSSGGISISGRGIVDATIRDCEAYQCSVGWRAGGNRIFLDRIFCHDNYAHNTSPHPVLSGSTNSFMVNCIFDASGWNASAGTMGIMLGPNYNLVIRNCHFLNQPDSGSHDQGGIDFECGGEANLVEKCTFRNNAGAAIEVLGLISPQTKNIEIANCKFDKNNIAHKLGPSEIFVWGGSKDPAIVCSSGLIRNNGYVLAPEVEFYINKAERTHKDWILKDNTQFNSQQELDQAMPYNNPPVPNAGPEIWTDNPNKVNINGTVTDDGKPLDGKLTTKWETLEGPEVTFENPDKPETAASFPAVGDYRILLTADDGELWRSARTAVHILPKGTKVNKAWAFDVNLDKQGWTDHDLGTEKEIFKAEKSFWSTFANPVNLVCGDYYVIAIKNAPNASILSPDNLDEKVNTLTIKFQNRTNSSKMSLSFITTGQNDWSAPQNIDFNVKPNDLDDTLYTIPIDSNKPIRQFKINFTADETPVTGTCRIDYIWIGNR